MNASMQTYTLAVTTTPSGVTTAQFFVGCASIVYGIKSDRQFVNTLEDNIQEHGAPTKLISDHAQVEISEKVQDILLLSLLVTGVETTQFNMMQCVCETTSTWVDSKMV